MSATKGTVVKVSGGTGAGLHAFTREEVEGIVDHINHALESNPDVKSYLPINPNNDDIFSVVADAVILSHFINLLRPGTISKLPKAGQNTYETGSSLDLVIKCSKGLGCVVANMGPDDLRAGVKKSYLILGLLWQLVRLDLIRQVQGLVARGKADLKFLGPQIVENMIPEEVLLRWMNFHIEAAGSSKRVKNFGDDIKDSIAYILVLSQVDKRANKEALKENDTLKRAKLFLATADKCGCKKFINEKDIVEGNSRLNFAFVANMFAKYTVEVEDEPEPEVATETKVDTAELTTNLLIDVEDKIDELEFEATKLRNERKKVLLEKGMIEEEIEELLDEIEEIKNQPDLVAEKLADNIKILEEAKTKQREEQNREIEELRRVLREAQVTAALDGDGPATEAATEFMEEELEDQIAQVVELQRQRDEIKALADAAKRKAERADRQLSHEEQKARHLQHKISLETKRMNTRLTDAKTDNQKLEEDITAVTTEVSTLDATRVALKKDIKLLEEKFAEEDTAKKRIAAVKRRLEKEVTKAEKDLVKTRREQTRNERIAAKLNRKVDGVLDATNRTRSDRIRLEKDTDEKMIEKEEVLDELDEEKHQVKRLAVITTQLEAEVTEKEDEYEETRVRGEEELSMVRKKQRAEIEKLKARVAAKKAETQAEVSKEMMAAAEVQGQLLSDKLTNIHEARKADLLIREQKGMELDLRMQEHMIKEAQKKQEKIDRKIEEETSRLAEIQVQKEKLESELEGIEEQVQAAKVAKDTEHIARLENERQLAQIKREALINQDLAEAKERKARAVAEKARLMEEKVQELQDKVEQASKDAQRDLEMETFNQARRIKLEEQKFEREKVKAAAREQDIEKLTRETRMDAEEKAQQAQRLEDETWTQERKTKNLTTSVDTKTRELDEAAKTRKRLEAELRKAQNLIDKEKTGTKSAAEKKEELRKRKEAAKARKAAKEASKESVKEDPAKKELDAKRRETDQLLNEEERKARKLREEAEDEARRIKQDIAAEGEVKRKKALADLRADKERIELEARDKEERTRKLAEEVRELEKLAKQAGTE